MQEKANNVRKSVFVGLTIILFASIIDLAFFGYWYTGKVNIIIAILIGVILNLYFLSKIIRDRQYHQLNQQLEEYEKTLIPIIEDLRISQHEFKNHLNTMYCIYQQEISQEVNSEITNYVNSLTDNMLELDNSLKIQNKILGSVLYSKGRIMRQKNIYFFIDAHVYNVTIPADKYETSYVINHIFEYILAQTEDRVTEIHEVIFRMDYDHGKPYMEIRVSGTDVFGNQNRKRNQMIKEIKKTVNKYSGKIILYHEASYSCLQVVFV